MAKFTTIGVGFLSKSKKGVDYINIRLDEPAMKAILVEDLKKICMFKKQSKAGKAYYELSAPMPDNYERPKYESGKETHASMDRTQSVQSSPAAGSDESLPF